MRLKDQISTMEMQSISETLIKQMMQQAKLSENFTHLSELEIIEEIIFAAKNFNILANTLYDGIHIVDSNGNIVYINASFSRISGLTNEIIGKNIKDLDEVGYNSEIASEVLISMEPVNISHSNIKTNISVMTTASPVFYDRDFLGIIIIDRDITELNRLQQELLKSEKHLKMMKKELQVKEMVLTQLSGVNYENVLIGKSQQLSQIREQIRQIAPLDATVLITGDTGSGKENIANEIHKCSNRKDKPFIKVNCSAIPPNLIESELFGYVKGAFTGASTTGKMGYFEMAQNGTLLLDEIGELPMALQPKLLRVIQQKEVLRIGATEPIRLNVRFIAATNRDLHSMCAQGTFRMDLFYRLNLFPINIPPLRNRTDDIIPLIEYFLAIYNLKYGKNTSFEDEAIKLMCSYDWPGNIRELENIIERMAIISKDDIAVSEDQMRKVLDILPSTHAVINPYLSLQNKIELLEKQEIINALKENKSLRQTAGLLGINASNVQRKMKKYGISRE